MSDSATPTRAPQEPTAPHPPPSAPPAAADVPADPTPVDPSPPPMSAPQTLSNTTEAHIDTQATTHMPTPAAKTSPSSDSPPTTPPRLPETLVGDPFELELLLVSGQRRSYTFGTGNTVEEAKRQVWEDWPDEWQKSQPRPPTVQHLRLLYLGRFLDDDKPLSSYKLGPASASSDDGYTGPVIVHLHIRSLLPAAGMSFSRFGQPSQPRLTR
ncbi:hypothetical protein JCM10207_008656 [Rhodosporidiobolus poonsookiae]